MVINYKRLNNNTRKIEYSFPKIEMLIDKIQNKKIFSKFDCKSGYWQVKIENESVPWTMFTGAERGHYEWLVMPFGLKNAPAIFLTKMDNIFKELDYCLVYIDDILVFSNNKNEHFLHLETIFKEFTENRIIISEKKMELFKEHIDFLGHMIGNGIIKIQPHIVKKILEFLDKMEETKMLQSFLGISNFARSYIKDLGRLAGPLYQKTAKGGQKYFNKKDIDQVQKIKEQVKNLPDLKLPLESEYKIIETDANKEGWGVILKVKTKKFTQRKEERIARFASGNFKNKNLPQIECEIEGIICAFENFKIYLRNPFTIRTDCKAIVRLYTYNNERKTSAHRWLRFIDAIQGNGYEVTFEHIIGEKNILADYLSRQANNFLAGNRRKQKKETN